MNNWKTTAQGVLSLLICVCVALVGTQSTFITPTVASIIALVLGVSKAVLGWLQNDAVKEKP